MWVTTSESIEERFAGTGVGRETVVQMCAETGTDEGLVLKRLRDAGLDAAVGYTLKTIADRRNLQPIHVLQVMIVGPRALPR